MTRTRFELKSNSTIFVKNKLWMKEILHAKVAVIQNVKFQHVVPFEVKLNKAEHSLFLLSMPYQELGLMH